MPSSHLQFVRTLDFGVLAAPARALLLRSERPRRPDRVHEAQQKRDAQHGKTKDKIAAKCIHQDRVGDAA